MQDFLGFQQEQLPATSAFDVSEQQPNLGVVPGAGFDSDYYLTQYPDVAEAVSQGTFEDAWEHWLLYGQYENRAIAPMPLNTSEDVRQPGQDYLTGMITDDIPISQDTLTTLPADGGTTQVNLIESYGKIPLSFEANQGQTDAQVNFLSRGNGYGVFLTPTEAVLSLRNPDTPATDNSGDNQTASGTVLRMELVGANAASQATGLEELATKSNYLKGNDSNQDLMDIPNYAQVKYENVYSGIDVIYYGNQRQLEYDFVVAPGADPNNIALNFQGADKVEIDAQGDLVLPTAGGEVRFYKPVIYQEVNGERQEVSGSYVIKDNQQVGFQVGSYDVSKTLIIDPVLSYSSYLGGSGSESPSNPSIVVDAQGNAYVTGTTTSPNFPNATGFNGGVGNGDNSSPNPVALMNTFDAFVAKLNPQGTQLLYSTYIGGSNSDVSGGIAVDKDGNAYIVGTTGSADFPAPNPRQEDGDIIGSSGFDIFAVKLNPTGGRVYSTIPSHTADYKILSGDKDGINETLVATATSADSNSIAVDNAGNVYITGSTGVGFFPTVNAAFEDDGYSGYSEGDSNLEGFVMKLNAAGTDIVYSTYINGVPGSSQAPQDIAVDSVGNAYVTGITAGNFPTLNAVQSTFGGGTSDAFVTKFNPTGGLVYSTYLGGSGSEQFDIGASGIAVDSNGNAYVTGGTTSTDFPKPQPEQKSFQPTYGGGESDAFVVKLSADGSQLLYSTYLGGSSQEAGYKIAVNAQGNAYVVGRTLFNKSLTNFPIENTLEETQNKDSDPGTFDAFVTKLSPDGSSVVYSTLLGGNQGDETGHDIAVDPAGNAYVTGFSSNLPGVSSDFPIKPNNAIQATYGGGDSDIFVAKISEDEISGEPENQVGSVGALPDWNLPIELTNAPSTNPTPTAGTENNETVTTDSPTNPTPATGTENNETVTTDSAVPPTPATSTETVDTTTTPYAPGDPIFDTDNLIKIVSDQEEPIYLLFDENYYLQQNPDVGTAVSEGIFKTGLRHFLQWGQIDANRPFRLLRFNFDEDTYLTQNPDVAAGASEGKIEPGIEHFLENGLTENRISNIQFTPSVQSLAFDEAYYLNKYPDVAESIADGDYVNGVEHFIKKGEKEQRDFRITTGNQSGKTLFFDENYYLANNPDVAEAVSQRKYRSGWQHFLKYGRFEGRKASTLID